MRKSIQSARPQSDAPAELQARKAIQKIQKWVEEKYPTIPGVAKARLIIECLIEVSEERRYMTAQ